MPAPSRCSVCQSLLDEEDLFCANCGAEGPHPDGAKRPEVRTSTHNFVCGGCGASMSYDASAGALRCPFCGSGQLSAQPDHREIAPDWVVPFAVPQEQAIQILRRWLGQGFWRPGDLSEQALVVSLTPVYVPYWVFEARTHSYWTADTSRTPYGAKSSWYPIAGERRGECRGLLVGASGALTGRETAAIAPFDLDQAQAREEVDLENAISEQFGVERKLARPQAVQGIEILEAQACTQLVPDKCRNLKVNVLVEGLTSQPVLLPAWIMAYRYREQLFRFVANGQTGKCTGTAPTSGRKIAAAVAIAIGVILLVLLFSALARGGEIPPASRLGATSQPLPAQAVVDRAELSLSAGDDGASDAIGQELHRAEKLGQPPGVAPDRADSLGAALDLEIDAFARRDLHAPQRRLWLLVGRSRSNELEPLPLERIEVVLPAHEDDGLSRAVGAVARGLSIVDEQPRPFGPFAQEERGRQAVNALKRTERQHRGICLGREGKTVRAAQGEPVALLRRNQLRGGQVFWQELQGRPPGDQPNAHQPQ